LIAAALNQKYSAVVGLDPVIFPQFYIPTKKNGVRDHQLILHELPTDLACSWLNIARLVGKNGSRPGANGSPRGVLAGGLPEQVAFRSEKLLARHWLAQKKNQQASLKPGNNDSGRKAGLGPIPAEKGQDSQGQNCPEHFYSNQASNTKSTQKAKRQRINFLNDILEINQHRRIKCGY
jgi:hypothetical protein